MMGWSIPLGRIAGTEVRIHLTFFLLIAWFAVSAGARGGQAAAIDAVIFLLAVFACVLAHEFGHVLAARRFGIPTRDITLLPIGGVANIERMPERPGQELIIALAGPAVNVVIVVLLIGVFGVRLGAGQFAADVLALFNLVPAFPMDGGRVLRALLAIVLGRLRATRLAARIGQMLAFLFGIAGLMGGGPILILIAVFVFLAAGAEGADVEMRALAQDRAARDAMIRDFRVLAPDDALSVAADAVIRTTQHEFPVIAPDGTLAGFLTRGALIEALAGRTAPARVRDAMAAPIPTLPPEAPLLEVIGALQAARAVIFTSVEKRVGDSLYTALAQTLDGSAPYGTALILGLADGAVGISKNAQYEALVPEAVRAEVEAQEAAIIAGEIEVVSTL